MTDLGRDVAVLEAVRAVGAEYGLRTSDVKPCVAVLLDGNIGAADRHEAAFTIAIECRRMGLPIERAERVLRHWAKKIDFPARRAVNSLRNAYAADASGRPRYYPPGLTKKQSGVYHRVLQATCDIVGCPRNCPPLMHVAAKIGAGGSLARYDQLEWPRELRRSRHVAADDVYRAIVRLERDRGIAPGGPIRTSFGQLAAAVGRDAKTVGRSLDYLLEIGLLSSYERGSGSGPRARDRRGSLVKRRIPIPAPQHPGKDRKSRHRGSGATQIGGPAPAEIGGVTPPDIGGVPPRRERRRR